MRTIGGTLAGLIAKGAVVPPEGGYNFKLKGYVGQTFGFCLVPGINLELTGIARDFVGEAMCGGEIVIKPPTHLASRVVPLAGASCAYGARGAKLFIAGKAGQRFGVRNSGGLLVSEGVGKYAFEYMTGGTGVVLGETGFEVGSGMFGGELFLWNGNDDVQNKLFKGQKKPKWMSDEEWGEKKQAVPMVADMSEEDYGKLWNIINEHALKTGSLRSKVLLEDWDNMKYKFEKVVPNNKPKPPVTTELGAERQRRGGAFPMMPKK
jgi:glutamate synthase (NADPH/NADH) large chain